MFGCQKELTQSFNQLNIDFPTFPITRPFLKVETILRQHATLSQGDMLIVNHGVLKYNSRVLELKPSSSISVLKTDIEVDITCPEPSEKEKTKYFLKPLILGKPENGVVDDDTWSRISSKDAKIAFNLESITQDRDTNLYVSKHPLLFPTQHQLFQ